MNNQNSAITLYEELGGETAIASVVELFYKKVFANKAAKSFFDGINMANQATMMTSFLGHVMRGPSYEGRSMYSAHKRLGLENGHFNLVIELLAKTLMEAGLSEDQIDKILAATESTRNEVLCLKKQVVNKDLI